jgi:hypothetical protein
MRDDSEVPPAEAAADSAARPDQVRRPSFFRRHWVAALLVGLVVVPAAIFTFWAGITLAFNYSSGERVGYVQKLSRKGWLCKTWEGELQMMAVPGTVPTIFAFSVRDDSVAKAIESAAGKQVALQYEEHRGVPSRCFGETDYFIVGVRVLGTPGR